MRRITTTAAILLLITLLCTGAQAAEKKLIYSRWVGPENYIFMSDASGKNEKKLFVGYDAEISPDGKKIAYTKQNENGTGERYIAIYDIASKKTAVLYNIPLKNNYGPRWSKSGKAILFSHYTKSNVWRPAIYDMEKKSVKIIAMKVASPVGKKEMDIDILSPFWSHDGEHIYGSDLYYLYKFSAASGKQEEVAAISSILPKGALLDSSVKFTVSDSGEALLFAIGMEDERCAKCDAAATVDPYKGAAFAYLLNEKRTVRISPMEYCTGYAAYGTDGDIYISAHKIAEKAQETNNYYDLYKITDSGKKVVPIAKKAYEASISK